MEAPLPLWQIDLFVDDLEASKHFHEGLGWRIEALGPLAGVAHLPGELSVAPLPATQRTFVAAFDSGHPGTTGGSALIDVRAEDREQVDALYRELLERGGSSSQPPVDAFWGSRYAVVTDPAGNRIGLKSPVDEARRSQPPDLA